jgi:stress-induced morphogen
MQATLYLNGLVKKTIFARTIGKEKYKMFTYKNFMHETFKCRICSDHFQNPEELRVHRMIRHKAHMLEYKR